MNKKKRLRQKYKKRTSKTQKKLKDNIPKSELWFLNELKDRNIEIPYLEHNELFGHYIPDFMSVPLKLVIEIDGSIHLNDDQIKRDIKKDEYYKNNGYTVIRVIAYDNESLIECFSKILIILESYRKSKVIKREPLSLDRIKTLCYTCETYKGKHVLEIKGITRKFCGYCISNAKNKWS